MQKRAALLDEKQPDASKYCNCETCPHGHETRKLWSCAWIAPEERSGIGHVPGDFPYHREDSPDICAGYLVSLPQVIEAARASGWRREGALAQFWDSPLTDIARTAVDIIDAEFKSCEQHTIRKNSSKTGGA